MKTTLNLTLALALGISIASTSKCLAQIAQAQTVTLAVNSQQTSLSYAVATNQLVQIISIAGNPGAPRAGLFHSSGVTATATNLGTFTGLTNITVYAGTHTGQLGSTVYDPGLVTLTITIPSNPSMIPANSVVIPADSTGPVEILLESSPDLVNWTGALPGTYGASATNRFFRVRALANP